MEELKCLNCGGSVSPTEEKCSYCGYYNGAYYKNKRNPVAKPEPEPTEEEEKSAPSYYSPSSSGAYLKQIICFGIVLLATTIIGTMFTNGTIQSDFTAGAIIAASLLGIILFLGAVRLINL